MRMRACCRSAVRLGCRLAVVLAVAARLASPGVTAELETAVGYAEWAKAAVASPPEGTRFLPQLADRLAELAAAARREHGADAAPLEADPGLELAAQAHALDMLERGYVDHVGPDGRAVGDRVAILHRRFIGGTGENLAEHVGIAVDELEGQLGPLARKLVDGWMASPGHRKNLVEPAYTHYGMAAAGAGERLVVVHVFGERRALLAQALPLEVEQGAELDLAIETGETPQQFAFAPPDTPVEDLVTLELSSSEVSVEPGEYRLKFFFPTERENYFAIVDGPELVVR
jgi:uncharacterized protein YkwD